MKSEELRVNSTDKQSLSDQIEGRNSVLELLESERDINKILIVKNSFIEKIAMKNVRKKVDLLTYRFNLALQDTEDEDTTSNVLGEAEMLKAMIISMYANYLGKENLDKIIKNINLLVQEFVKAKTLQNTFIARNIEQQRRR